MLEFDLLEAGFDVDWIEVDVPEDVLKEENRTEIGTPGEGGDSSMDGGVNEHWKGVKRRYWNIDKYRLPLCRFIG